MKHNLSIVFSTNRVHCAVIPRGQITSNAFSIDKEIKPYHTQFLLITTNCRPRVYGVSGTLPSGDCLDEILRRWSERQGKAVALVSQLRTSKPTRQTIRDWLTHATPVEQVWLTRTLNQFPEEETVNAQTQGDAANP